MKIILKRSEPIRVYHHPCDVLINSKTKTVEILEGGARIEAFNLIEKDVHWTVDPQNYTEELILTLTVQ